MSFVMLMGISGSGKSTIAAQIAQSLGARIYSSDNYRKIYYGNEGVQKDPGFIFARMNADVINALKRGEDIIYDATNLNRKRRIQLLKSLPYVRERQIVMVLCHPDECIKRDSERSRSVGADVIWKQIRNFEVPMMYEGWSSISITYTSSELYDASDLMKSMVTFDQDNPHHKRTLGHHCLEAEQRVGDDDLTLKKAARWHDVGKLVTKQYDKEGVAHYFNHANAGAYMSFFIMPGDNMLDVAALINFHMHPFNANDKHTKENLGEMWNKVMKLHEADIVG